MKFLSITCMFLPFFAFRVVLFLIGLSNRRFPPPWVFLSLRDSFVPTGVFATVSFLPGSLDPSSFFFYSFSSLCVPSQNSGYPILRLAPLSFFGFWLVAGGSHLHPLTFPRCLWPEITVIPRCFPLSSSCLPRPSITLPLLFSDFGLGSWVARSPDFRCDFFFSTSQLVFPECLLFLAK